MALKHEGYSVMDWDEWSRADSRYHAGECEKKWHTFKGSAEPVTAGTIVQMAKDRGLTFHAHADDNTLLDYEGVIAYEGESEPVTMPDSHDPVSEIITYLRARFEPDEYVGYVTSVYADLETFRIVKEYDGKEVAADTFGSLEEMLPALESLDFGDLVYLSDEEKGITQEETAPAVDDDDTPLFSQEALEELDRSTSTSDFSFTPFGNDDQGEQLSLFDDPEPPVTKKTKKEKPKSEFAAGPFVDGINVYEALAAEIMRGTGFENGKLRVQDFFDKNAPTIEQLADFLKREYGIGGHSGEGIQYRS